MPNQYLLPCDCGKSVRVEPLQAGDRVACECGAELEVPPLRQIRQLPEAPDETGQKPSGQWGFRQGVLTAGLLVALALCGVGGWWWATEPATPGEFDPGQTSQRINTAIDDVGPSEAFTQWVKFYSLDRPLEPMMSPRVQEAISRGHFLRKVRWTFFGAAAAAAVLSIVAYSQIKPTAG